MRVLIIGCGRVGARTAMELDRRGENVTIIDSDQRAFLKLPAKFGGASLMTLCAFLAVGRNRVNADGLELRKSHVF